MVPLRHYSLFLVCLMVTGTFIPAQAAVIFDQTLSTTNPGEYSNLGPSNQQVADDFQLTGITLLESISWVGRYGDESVSVSDPVSFSIRFFAETAGSPAVSPLLALDVAVEAVSTGSSYGDIPLLSYSADIPYLLLGPGTYWVSVLENDSDTPMVGATQWLWADSTTRGYRAFRDSDGASWSTSLDINHAFTLDGTTAPVPEPATMLLLGSGLFWLGGFGRRLRR